MAIEYTEEFEKHFRKLEARYGKTWGQKETLQGTWYHAQINLLDYILHGGSDWEDIEKSLIDLLEELKGKAPKL